MSSRRTDWARVVLGGIKIEGFFLGEYMSVTVQIFDEVKMKMIGS